MLKSVALLFLFSNLVLADIFTPCFDSVTLTVYRTYKKIILERADTINDEQFATEIIAQNQKIPLLQTGCFKNLRKLQYVTLNKCGLEGIEPAAFYNLPNLRSISISFNHLHMIRNGVFHSLGIVKLMLIANGIEEIQQHAFYNLTSLEILDLSRNNLYTLKPDIFFNTFNLRQINLSHNKLVRIEDYFFWDPFAYNLDTVTSLIDLSGNSLTTINRNTFKGVYYIHSLLLNDNHIESINPKVFSNLRKGKSLDLRDNKLENIPDQIKICFEEVLYDGMDAVMYKIDPDTQQTTLNYSADGGHTLVETATPMLQNIV